MKKIFGVAIALLMCLWGCAALAQVDPAYQVYDCYGRVTNVQTGDEGAVIQAEGYYGYHMDDEPSMTVQVEIGRDGIIRRAAVVSAKDQTQGFAEMVTQEYMDQAYGNMPAVPTLEVDAVAGATATSQAVTYAVQTAAWYAQKALGFVPDTHAQDKAELNRVFPADYTAIESEYKPAKKIGTVLYAAHGTAPDGRQVVGMKVKSALTFAYKGSAGTGWTASEPSAFTMAIVVDEATDQVCAWDILVDGTKRSQYFQVPQEKIDAYSQVVIGDETAFDDFTDGLVMALEYELEDSEEGPLITGTSIVYTGKTEQGSFSSQLVRNCFRTAAAYYCNAVG